MILRQVQALANIMTCQLIEWSQCEIGNLGGLLPDNDKYVNPFLSFLFPRGIPQDLFFQHVCVFYQKIERIAGVVF